MIFLQKVAKSDWGWIN